MNPEKKYAMATICIPIEIKNEGDKYEIMNDRITIDIQPCLNLPEPSNLDNVDLLTKIFSVHVNQHGSGSDEISPLSEPEKVEMDSDKKEKIVDHAVKLLSSERTSKHPKSRKNISFKQYPRSSKWNTRRVYSKIEV
jgi:hypothetical protein